MGQGYMALTAVDAITGGANHEEVVAKVRSLIPRSILYGSLSTLKYLALGGRVSNLAASMANMLNIRPILCVHEGKLDLLEKVRTRKAAMDRMVELLVKAVGDKSIERICIVHVLNEEDAEFLKSKLASKLKLPDVVDFFDFGTGLSVHTGVGLVGCFILTGE
jgi:DegV family protein with EDD domain